MKDKILQTEIIEAAERLATALRKFSGDSLYLNLTIISRDTNLVPTNEDDSSDFYSFRCHETKSSNPVNEVLTAGINRIHRNEDGGIKEVTRIFNEDIKL